MIPVMSATNVRKEWSAIVDSTVRIKPRSLSELETFVSFQIFLLWRSSLRGTLFRQPG